MMAAGYNQSYRKEIIRNSIKIYDHKLQNDIDDIAPLNHTHGYWKIERQMDKKLKNQSWGTRGGYVAPIIIPDTLGGELADKMHAVCKAEAIPGLRFKVVERGGVTIMRQLQNSHPTASDMCGRPNCGPCVQPGGMSGSKHCQKPNVVYEYSCQFPSCDWSVVQKTQRGFLGQLTIYFKAWSLPMPPELHSSVCPRGIFCLRPC